MRLISEDFVDGGQLPLKAVSSQLGGKDDFPCFQFFDVPTSAKSLALTCYDPDAPTGSGFWHWIVVNIPIQTEGVFCDQVINEISSVVKNDADHLGYSGAHPPEGDSAHRYIFTLHALSCEKIDVDDLSQAFVRFFIKKNEIAEASMIAMFSNNPKKS